MDREKLRELAAEVAHGTAGAAEQAAFHTLLAEADSEARHEIGQLFDMAALLSINAARQPSPGLKAKVLANVLASKTASAGGSDSSEAKAASESTRGHGFSFVRADDTSGWRQLAVRGASVKVLSLDRATGYATVMGKLEAGARYPSHAHSGAEQIYMVSGDLMVGDVHLKAGDFHRAAAGSVHGENYSETGCVIIAILSVDDLQAQLALASA